MADPQRAGRRTAWVRSIQSATPAGALRLGLVLSAANPKIVLLAAPAGLAIGAEAPSAGAATGAALLFTAVAAASVAVPVAMYAVAGERIVPALRAAGTWLETNNQSIMAVVITIIGLVVLVKGIGGLEARSHEPSTPGDPAAAPGRRRTVALDSRGWRLPSPTN